MRDMIVGRADLSGLGRTVPLRQVGTDQVEALRRDMDALGRVVGHLLASIEASVGCDPTRLSPSLREAVDGFHRAFPPARWR